MSLKNKYTIAVKSKIGTNHKKILTSYHYKGTTRSLKERYVFELLEGKKLVGVAIFGDPFSARAKKKYGDNILEIRRIALIDNAPYNSESFFIGACLRYLKKNTDIEKIITYSDPTYGHTGTIYKASNFEYIGTEKYTQKWLVYNGRDITARMVYQKDKAGNYVDSALKYQRLVKSGKLNWEYRQKKHIYQYILRK